MRTVSLELAKQLKEKGYLQKSYFAYYQQSLKKHMSDVWVTSGDLVLRSEFEIDDDDDWEERYEFICSSPTADEILEKLPYHIGKFEAFLQIEPESSAAEGGWLVAYFGGGKTKCVENARGRDSLADAVAKMWLYLKENNLL